jgi:hypothetical protein
MSRQKILLAAAGLAIATWQGATLARLVRRVTARTGQEGA